MTPELGPLGGVAGRDVECPLGDPDGLGADDRSRPIEGLHRVPKGGVLVADAALGGYDDVVEEDLPGR